MTPPNITAIIALVFGVIGTLVWILCRAAGRKMPVPPALHLDKKTGRVWEYQDFIGRGCPNNPTATFRGIRTIDGKYAGYDCSHCGIVWDDKEVK